MTNPAAPVACSECQQVKPIKAKGLCGACFWGGMNTNKVKAAMHEMNKPTGHTGARNRSLKVGERYRGGLGGESARNRW